MKQTLYLLSLLLVWNITSCKPALPAELQALENLEIFSVSDTKDAIILDWRD